jgi:hypothetical protein
MTGKRRTSGKKARSAQQQQVLSAEERAFALAYLETKPLDAVEAYRRTFPLETGSAVAIASRARRLVNSPRVRAFVADRMALLERQASLSVERIDAELACAAFFDPADILDPETGATLPVQKWPAHARRALVGFEEEALFESVPTGEVGPRGGAKTERVQVGVVRKFRWHNKTDAQRLAYQRRGALVERHEVTMPAIPEPTQEELEAVARLRHEVMPHRGGGNG